MSAAFSSAAELGSGAGQEVASPFVEFGHAAQATGPETGEVAAGAALPPHTVSNADLTARLDTTDEWIRSRTGIARRHIAGAELSTTDLAVRAAARALADGAQDTVEALAVATTTPDRCCPATAPAIATRLGLTEIPVYDLAAGCTGFLYALATAAGLIAAGTAQTALVTGADLIRAPCPGALHMDGPDVFRHAVDRMSTAARQAVTAAGWNLADVDRLVPHQANSRISVAVARHLGSQGDRLLSNIADTGNTGAASIPLLLARSAADGRLKPGHRTLLTAFGAGLTWGATTLTWPDLSAALFSRSRI